MAFIRLQGQANPSYYYEFNPENRTDIIGEGGMGKVYKGKRINKDTGNYSYVAIKVLFNDLPVENITRAKKEAAIHITHENLVRMYDFIETKSEADTPIYHIISEYLEGQTLNHFIQESRELSWKKALEINKQILAGLYMLHEKGFVHRDIDPSNIMLCTDGSVKLIDFGIVKKMNDYDTPGQLKTADGKFLGKVLYASPEQVNGEHSKINITSDIYSSGILLFELLTGKLPYGGTTYEIIKAHLEKPVPVKNLIHLSSDKKVVRGLQYILNRATEKHPGDRYQSSSEFITDIEKLLNGISPLPVRTRKWIYAVPFILILAFGFWIINKNRKTQYHENYETAGYYLQMASYENALLSYENAHSIRKSDSIERKMAMLRELIPATKAYISADYHRADSLFRIAAAMGSSDAQYYLGEMNFEGTGIPKNYKQGFIHTQKAVNMGNKLALYRLGLVFRYGLGQKTDIDRAQKSFEEALYIISGGAKDENPELQYIKANIYYHGYGVNKSLKNAEDLYKSAAGQGYPRAQFQLYKLFKNKNIQESENWLMKAANQGLPSAQVEMADILLERKDYISQYKWLKKAGDNNYAPALRKLGAIFQESPEDPRIINFKEANNLQSNDSLSYDFLSRAVKYDPEYESGRYSLALMAYNLAAKYYDTDSLKARKYLEISQQNIRQLSNPDDYPYCKTILNENFR